MNNKLYLRAIIINIMLIFLLSLSSCKNMIENVSSKEDMISLKVSLQGSFFKEDGILKPYTSATKNINFVAEKKQELALKENSDYRLIATLSRVNNTNINLQALGKKNLLSTDALTNGIKYKVVVYDNYGNYVKEKDYISGQEEAIGGIIGLYTGKTYTFIAYSIGSQTFLPPIDTSVKYNDTSVPIIKLLDMKIPITSDLMYYYTTKQLVDNAPNSLNINLEHKFSQIITTLDASSTGNLLKSVDGATIDSNFNNVSLFSNGSYVSTGTGNGYQTQSLNFQTINNTTVKADPIYINNSNGTSNATLHIGTLTMIGSDGTPDSDGSYITHKNVVLNGLKITPGVKYNLNLSIIVKDGYLNYRGYPAVRINGFVWMRYNLGADYTMNPEGGNPNAKVLIGNYYQFGRKIIVADSNTPPSQIAGWDAVTDPPNTSWNKGDTTKPLKVESNDPCPNGWRIPTHYEYYVLHHYTMYGGKSDQSITYYSKYNPDVKISFPIESGYRDSGNGRFINLPGDPEYSSMYWTSTAGKNINSYYYVNIISNTGERKIYYNDHKAHPSAIGMQIRCIAESPID
ncbi:MAG: hypothetical protein LBE39_11805 [Flavobacteriaceae bacterium]|jgi:uncharacterized protein (TIGR02145 family)|nr:hypothetical protein [Flavobacteriaceae bacterium]